MNRLTGRTRHTYKKLFGGNKFGLVLQVEEEWCEASIGDKAVMTKERIYRDATIEDVKLIPDTSTGSQPNSVGWPRCQPPS